MTGPDFHQTLDDPDCFRAGGAAVTINDLIGMVDATDDNQWQMDVVRSADGTRNCFFGHLHAYGMQLADTHPGAGAGVTVGEAFAQALWDWFEECWATTYMVYPVNDGTDPHYPQPTPRTRVGAFLRDLRDGKALRTHQIMEQHDAMNA